MVLWTHVNKFIIIFVIIIILILFCIYTITIWVLLIYNPHNACGIYYNHNIVGQAM